MTFRASVARIVMQEDINFLLTNRIPRRLLTRFMGWFSRIEQPLVRDFSIALWRLFSDLDLSDARKTHFRSLHDCFVRELKTGARPLDTDPDVMVSPCDGIVGAHGRIEGTTVLQVKGFPYRLDDLLGSAALAERYRDGTYVTLRLTSSMYHRFHAPADGTVKRLTYISGDTWNVNPIALRRIENLFCKNERAVIEMTLDGSAGERPTEILLVPVAAILVASIRLNFLPPDFEIRRRQPRALPCAAFYSKGDEMGRFEHGSTIIVLAPPGVTLGAHLAVDSRIRMGEPLLRRA